MRRWWRETLLAGPLLVGFGCSGPDPDQTTCQEMCDQLVNTCGYAAYPDVGSCVQGCLFSASVGGDVEGQMDCVFLAQCDTFAVVECEHQYGPDPG